MRRPSTRQTRYSLRIVALAVLALCIPPQRSGARFEGFDGFDPEADTFRVYALRQPYLYYHNAGLLGLMVTNLGVLGSLSGDHFGANWHGGEYLWGAALWVGVVAEDGLAYVSTGYAWTEEEEFELRPSTDPSDRLYTCFEGIDGGNRPGFSDDRGDDDRDGIADDDFLNGRDDDGDGSIDEDYSAIGQQMFSCEYSDDAPEALLQHPDHRPLHIRIRQRSMVWSAAGSNEFVGIDYEITNEGFERLRDLHIGWYVDPDVGRKEIAGFHTDDRGGLISRDTLYVNPLVHYTCSGPWGYEDCSRRQVRMDLAYAEDTPGSAFGMHADDLTPSGCVGALILGHTTDAFGEDAPVVARMHTCSFVSGAGPYPVGDPRGDFERYDLLSGGARRLDADRPADYRFCISTDRFPELLPGQSLSLRMALVGGESHQDLLSNALSAQRIQDGTWVNVDGLRETGCRGRETCVHVDRLGEAFWWRDPCDLTPPLPKPIKFKNLGCERESYWVDNDCSCCTPLQASAYDCQGWEALAPWVGEIALPHPGLNLEHPSMRASAAGDRSVTIEWDNLSEIVSQGGLHPLCGYRVWRVEGWRRPPGSFGPAPGDWQPLAELAIAPRDFQLNLADYTNDLADVVDTLSDGAGTVNLLYEVGRYSYTDTLGLKNGMLYFYDVTAYSCWVDADGNDQEMDSRPAAVESNGVTPRGGAADGESWRDCVQVIPNPWEGGAEWDLTPNDGDPTGSHIDFVNLPARDCELRIYTLTGDLVRQLYHDPGPFNNGTVRWNMLSRNGQEITSGVYLFAIRCGGDRTVGRFTVIR